jgi:hypothetical protein
MKKKSVALVRAEKALESAKSRARSLAKRYNQPPLMRIGTQVAGGALSGVAQVYSPIQDVMGVPVDAIAGVALVAVGSFTKGTQSDLAINLGTGMLCAVASRYTKDMLQQQ